MFKVCEPDLFLLLEVYTKNLEDNPEMEEKVVAKKCIKEFKEFLNSMKPHTEIAEKIEEIAKQEAEE